MDELLLDLQVASAIAERRGTELLARRAEGITGVREKSAALDLASDLDRAAEASIVAELGEYFPGDSFLGEESGRHGSEGARRWVIDPIDGSVNFIRGIGPWAIGMCRIDHGEAALSIVHLPETGEIFAAARGVGFFVGGELRFDRRSQRPDGPRLAAAVVETFLLDTSWAKSADELGVLFGRARQMRVYNATLAALAFVADARLDGCVGRDMSPWDWEPGALLVRESGGIVAQAGPYVYAAGRGCAEELAACLAPRLPRTQRSMLKGE